MGNSLTWEAPSQSADNPYSPWRRVRIGTSSLRSNCPLDLADSSLVIHRKPSSPHPPSQKPHLHVRPPWTQAPHLRTIYLRVRTVGEAQTGYVGDAADDPDVERERSWTWMEEVAEIDVLDLMMRVSIKFRDCTNIILFIRCIGNGVTEMYYIVVHHLSNSCYPTEILKKEPTWNDFAKFFLLLILIWD